MRMKLAVPLKEPKPDIEKFVRVIKREEIPERPPFIELLIDPEIVKYITEQYLGIKWIEPDPKDRESEKKYYLNYIQFWYRLGYDCIRISGGLNFPWKSREAEDTALLKRGVRTWVEEGVGMISSWEEFELYPWENIEEIDTWYYEFVAKNLPVGMGLLICPGDGILETVLNIIFGYENLCYLLYDNPSLVREVFDRVGGSVYNLYKKMIGLPRLTGFFQGDDMGFKTSTLISPEALRQYVLPWHKKIADLAHEHGLLYILHACGNLESIMEDLIEGVKIDAKHSFEDEIIPVGKFKKKYSGRIAVLGGVDVDKLARLSDEALREYVRAILDECMPGGGYALGSGNSIANYIPPENYLTMLDEGLRWG